MSNRFDYVKYDQRAINMQNHVKEVCQQLEEYMQQFIPEGRPKSLALTSLEEFYMWVGKAIRDDQLTRVNNTELQEQRGDA